MAKRVMEVAVVVPLNDVTENVLQGQRFERVPSSSFVTLLATGSAAGLEQELNIGGESVTPRMPVNTNNRSPLVPDDLIVDDAEAIGGELLQLSVRNTTAANLTYRARVILEEATEFAEDAF